MKNLLFQLFILALAAKLSAQTSHFAQLTWGSSPTVGAAYNVKRATVKGGPYTTVSSLQPGTTFKDTNLAGNTFYCYVITAQSTGTVESLPTNEACGITSKDQAGSPSGTVTVVFQ